MLDQVRYPLIYCPPNVARPAGCPHMVNVGLVAGAGPDVGRGGAGGGVMWGGPYDPATAEQQWQQTPGGRWVLPGTWLPQQLLRVRPHPQVLRWHMVPGCSERHSWRVPVLLSPLNPKELGDGLAPATDRVWRGRWKPSPGLEALMERLLRHIYLDNLDDAQQVQLAVDCLSLGMHVDADTLAGLGWLSQVLLDRVFLALCDQVEIP